MRPRHILAATSLVFAVLAGFLAAAPARSSDSPFVPVTAAERSQTRPLVTIVLAAHRSGDFSSLCAFASEREIREGVGTRARCRTMARRNPLPPCGRCTFRILRVVGVYATQRDRTERGKTVVWLVGVKNDPQFKGESELELGFFRERGRWVLSQILQAGSAR